MSEETKQQIESHRKSEAERQMLNRKRHEVNIVLMNLADETEAEIAQVAENCLNMADEEVLEWLTNELLNRRQVCRWRP